METKERPLDIYLMGIGGTGMGAFAGLLKQSGHRVFGSDSAVYSPMKEKLAEWGISFQAPYSEKNIPHTCDLVVIGNVIRRDNLEAALVLKRNLPYESFPRALNKFFLKNATPIVASGTHGKTTCGAMLSHALFEAGFDPGFLIGGIPLNFGESFRILQKKGGPFVVEGDEYDTAFFDKRPKFIHYDPKFLLVTSLEFDHGDIYRDLNAVIEAFVLLMKALKPNDTIVINKPDDNIKTALLRASCKANIISYGNNNADYQSANRQFNDRGIFFTVIHHGKALGDLFIPLFGEHNLSNALGCYALLHQYGLSHQEIKNSFANFLGVKRRLEERIINGQIMLDDFAHHPSAVKETIKAAKQKYPKHKICAIFEPRSATSCMKIFEISYQEALMLADKVIIAPVGRKVAKEECIDTEKIAQAINLQGIPAKSFLKEEDLRKELPKIKNDFVLLFMSNGDFQGLLNNVDKILDLKR